MSESTVETVNYERRVLADGDVSAVRRGQWLSWFSATGGTVSAVMLRLADQPWLAAALV